jgi:uncharacterized protein YmfQ (DUF2313 family)
MMDASAYARQLQQLLPRGAAWWLEPGTTLSNLLQGLAEELARIDGRAATLIEEWDPRTTAELLDDWERVYGLPDPCVGSNPSTAQRRASLVAKVMGLGGQTPAYFVAIAAALGFSITITELSPHDVDDDVDAPLYGDEWAYAWQVNAPLSTVNEWSVDDTVDDPLAWWTNLVLECVLLELKPAHTVIVFQFGEPTPVAADAWPRVAIAPRWLRRRLVQRRR